MGLPQRKHQPADQAPPASVQGVKLHDVSELNSTTAVEPKISAEDARRKADFVARFLDWRRNLSLSVYLSIIVFIAIVTASSLAGIYAFQLQYNKALQDTWAIMYLDGERIAEQLSNDLRGASYRYVTRLKDSEKVTGKLRAPDVVYKIEKERRAKPVHSKREAAPFTAASLGLETISFSTKWNVIKNNGIVYVMRNGSADEAGRMVGRRFPAGQYLLGWGINFRSTFRKTRLDRNRRSQNIQSTLTDVDNETIYYFITRGGKLINTTDRGRVDEDTLATRPLVQAFINSKLRTAQIEFDNFGTGYYGFYYEIPGTNMIMMSETSRYDALSAVWSALAKFIVVMIVLVIAALFLVQLPMANVIRPISELVVLSREVARGNFLVKPKHRGFGEVVLLTRSFSSMAKNLVIRDQSIRELMVEQQAKLKLEREIGVAKTLQENLLPKNALTVDSGLSMTSVYIPYAQVAGDWFTYDYSPETGETVIVVADVSGHDISASLITAIIAGIFYEVRDNHPSDFPMDDFSNRLNRRIKQFGGGRWHATMQVVKFVKGNNKFEVYNCGHTFPMIISPDEQERKSKVVRMPSEPLGLAEDAGGKHKTIDLHLGDTLIMYTDGIIETKSPQGKNYGTKRLMKTAKRVAGKPTHEIVHTILKDCEGFRVGAPADDDTCLLAIRIGS